MTLLYKTMDDCHKATAVVSDTFAGAYDHKPELMLSSSITIIQAMVYDLG